MKTLRNLFVIAVLALFAVSCENSGKVRLIPVEKFQTELDGKPVSLYTLTNDNGLTVQLTNYGARVVSLWVPDRDGKFRDVVLGMGSIQEYFTADEKYYGATVGRYANRIAAGRFSLEGREYQLDVNDGKNHLHGGTHGLHAAVWAAEPYEQVSGNQAILFRYTSPDGEMGYPGTLDISVRYVLSADNELRIYYEATTDSATIVNLSHHSYFNLNGVDGKEIEPIENHVLRFHKASAFTPTDNGLIPTGEIRAVAGTPLDFSEANTIGERINDDYEPLKIAGGYDHNWVNDQWGMTGPVAEIHSPVTGIRMVAISDRPGVQFYSGNFIKGVDKGKWGAVHRFRSAFCIETQD
ncbi:MAG: galactose mutarotase, partial [Rikenellaceae bacterium]|nr:galactose mutarotase [Rikenellaceae bacterium]